MSLSALICVNLWLLTSYHRHASAKRLRSFQAEPGHALLKQVDFQQVLAGLGRSINDERESGLLTGRKAGGQRSAAFFFRRDLPARIQPMTAQINLKLS